MSKKGSSKAEKKADKKAKAEKSRVRADGTMSGLDAAAKVLAESKEPLNAKQIVERALAQGLWKTKGKTPHATVYASLIRDIAKRSDQSRFRKADRGKFTIAS